MQKVRVRRERVYKYILDRLGEGCSPTVREICEDLSIPSTSTVHSDLHYLMDQGMIEMDEGRNRTIRLPGSATVHVPLVGTVTAGEPILAIQNVEQYIPISMLAGIDRESLFALRVRGDSMKDAAILEDDIVVVQQTPVAHNGEIVVAMIEDEATVKRFYKENGHFRLQPENEMYEPIITEQVEILGRVVSIFRIY